MEARDGAPHTAPSRRRRILFLTPQLPYPPEQGAAIRNLNLVTQVAQRHDVALLSFTQEAPCTAGPLEGLCRPLGMVPAPQHKPAQRLRTLLTTASPDMAFRLRSDAFAQALLDLLSVESFDIVQIEGVELAPYGLMIREWLGEDSPALVLDEHNAEYVLQRRAFEADIRKPGRWHAAAYSWAQWRRLARFERQVCLDADAVVAVSEADAAALRALAPGIVPLVVPNGVDVNRFHPNLPDALPLEHPAVVFTGRMDFRPNVDAMEWFHERIWPLIRAQRPDARLYVVGKAPHAALSPLALDPSVTVTGYVADVLPYFGGADVYVVPLRMGGGTRLKVLEAMAAGLPLVSTTIGAEGIAGESGEYLLLADGAQAFADAVLDVLHKPTLRARLGAAARRYVVQNYDWRRIVPRLEPLYAAL
ncbi:MAG: glycosyltransferase [Chloroflexi bacterium]|nr:glycosyltransferase [Chloroflexota bacterium]